MLSPRLIVVENERLIAQDIAQILQDDGYIIQAIASDGETAISEIVECPPDLVLLDIHINGKIDGIDVAKFIQSYYNIPIIYLTAFSDAETLKRAQLTNPMGYIVKPFREEQLRSSVSIALATHATKYASITNNAESHLKDRFLSIISHELRNPLNAILGFSECLRQEILGSVNPEQIEALSIINDSGSNLLKNINNIIDLSMIETGKFKLQVGLVPISEICKTSLEYIQTEAFSKAIKIETKIPDNLPYLMLDERRIFQVLLVLLKNAVKFTPYNGCITLEVKLEQDFSFAENTSSIHVSVTDTGIGITSADIDNLFQLFGQFDTNFNNKFEDIGLELVIVKNIIELHGGHLRVTSKLGQGSRFTFSLPC